MKLKFEKRNMYLVLGILIYMCLGSIYSWSIFKKPLEEALGISATSSGMPYMVFLVTYAFTMPLVGGFIEKFGPRNISLVGGIITCIAWFSSSFAGNIVALIMTYGILGGMGVGIIYGAPMAVSAKWFPEKKGFAVGLTLAGFGLSPFVTAPLARYLIQNHGVFSTFRILGTMFLVILVLAIPLKFPENKDDSNSKGSRSHGFDNAPLKQVLTNRKFILLWICFIIGTFTGLMAIGISSPVAQEIIGLDPAMSSFAVSLFAIFNGIGRPIFGAITDKLKFRKTALISYILIIFASTLMLNAKEGAIFIYVLSFAIFWLILGGWLAIAPTAVSNMFGARHYARNYGFLFTAYGIGAILGTLVSGIIKDSYGSYSYVFNYTILTAFVGILLVYEFFIKKMKK